MTTQAIFLSYASQDTDAARRICEALRAAGLEVWFDQSELRGGDAWDQSIRKQIKECTLFVPVISANTEVREEGYFRREWNLAVSRMLDMADDKAFLLPVLIDGTPEPAARVPERFRERQWSRLNSNEAIAAFAQRVAKLLDGRPIDRLRTGAHGEMPPKGAPVLGFGLARARQNGRHALHRNPGLRQPQRKRRRRVFLRGTCRRTAQRAGQDSRSAGCRSYFGVFFQGKIDHSCRDRSRAQRRHRVGR